MNTHALVLLKESRVAAPKREPILRASRLLRLPAPDALEDTESFKHTIAPYWLIAMLTQIAQSDDERCNLLEARALVARISQSMPEAQTTEECVKILVMAERSGFPAEYFAHKLAHLFFSDVGILEALLEDAIAVAYSDGPCGETELALLSRIAAIFGVPKLRFHQQLRIYSLPGFSDPYRALGVDRSIDELGLKRAYRNAVKTCHPDALAQGNRSAEMTMILNDRFTHLANAYEMIKVQKKF